MFSCKHDARQRLQVHCREVQTYVKDDTIAILPKERYAILETLNAFHLAIDSEGNIVKSLEKLQSCFSRMALSINLVRYHALAKSIEKANALISLLLQESCHKESKDANEFYLYLRHKGVIQHQKDLESGNVASVTRAFREGYLTISEAADAVTALMHCQHQLQLCHLAEARAFNQRQVAA